MRFIKNILLFCAVWILVAAVANGCTCIMHNYYYTKPRPVYATSAPPEAKVEKVPPSPGPRNAWIPGHWYFDDADEKWVWQKGFWELPPQEGATWIAPTYDNNEGDTVFWPGYWNPPGQEAPEPIDAQIPTRPEKAASTGDPDGGDLAESAEGGAEGATDAGVTAPPVSP